MEAIVAERLLGTREILGTQWPIVTRVRRDQRPGQRPQWVLETLCNGACDRGETYRTRREALRAFEGAEV
jgi:hypothetical protein